MKSLLSILILTMVAPSAHARNATTAGERLYLSTVEHCDVPKVKELLAAGVDATVTLEGDDTTALGMAAYANCSTDMIATLIAAGVNPNQKNRVDLAPIHTWLMYNNRQPSDSLVALLKGGANPNLIGSNGKLIPLEQAVDFNRLDCVTLLLNAGAKPAGTNAFAKMVKAQGWNTAELMLQAGANPNEQIKTDVGTAPALCWAITGGNVALIDRLVTKYGANVSTKTSLGDTSVHCALRHFWFFGTPSPEYVKSFEENVQEVVKYGLKLGDKDPNGSSVLQETVNGVRKYTTPNRAAVGKQIVDFLISQGAPSEQTLWDGSTALAAWLEIRPEAGTEGAYYNLATSLATKEAAAVQNLKGQSPLMVLIERLSSESPADIAFARLLIAQGVNLAAKDKGGKTAYTMAMKANLLNIGWEIEKHGGK